MQHIKNDCTKYNQTLSWYCIAANTLIHPITEMMVVIFYTFNSMWPALHAAYMNLWIDLSHYPFRYIYEPTWMIVISHLSLSLSLSEHLLLHTQVLIFLPGQKHQKSAHKFSFHFPIPSILPPAPPLPCFLWSKSSFKVEEGDTLQDHCNSLRYVYLIYIS